MLSCREKKKDSQSAPPSMFQAAWIAVKAKSSPPPTPHLCFTQPSTGGCCVIRDLDRALKPGPHSNLLHPERTNASDEAAEGKSKVMDRDTLKERAAGT